MIEGGCRCGACRYTIERLPAVYCCHCTVCQTMSGSAFAEQGFMPAAWLAATGPVQPVEATSPSGVASRSFVCPTCTTRMWSENDRRPGFVVLRVGTLDDTTTVEPCAHIWVSSKQRWFDLPAHVPQIERMEPLADFLAVLQRASA